MCIIKKFFEMKNPSWVFLFMSLASFFSHFAGTVHAQNVADYATAMDKIGCGEVFQTASKLPVPIEGYSSTATSRLRPRFEFRTTASGSGSVDMRSPESVRADLLLNPINKIDGMNMQTAKDIYSVFLIEKNQTGNTNAIKFEKAASEVMLCVLEKRKGLVQEAKTVEGKLASLGDSTCDGHVKSLLDMYEPPPSPGHDLIIKSLRDGQNAKKSDYNWANNYNGDNARIGATNFSIDRVHAPVDLRQALQMKIFGEQGRMKVSSQAMPLVPSPAEIKTRKDWLGRYDEYNQLANYWVCQRSAQIGLVKWFEQNPNAKIFWSSKGPSIKNPNFSSNVVQIYSGRLSDLNGKPTLVSEMIFACLNGTKFLNREMSNESQLSACQGETTRYSPELTKLQKELQEKILGKKTIFISTSELDLLESFPKF